MKVSTKPSITAKSRPVRQQGGAALVLVMWLVAALSILASGLAATARVDLRGTQMLKEFALHAALGDAAIRLAASQLSIKPLEDAPAWFEFDFEGRLIEVEVVPASALINLNHAPVELLHDLFFYAGELDEAQAQMLAERVIDWRDGDEDPLPNGAEEAAYVAAQSPFRPRNGLFETVDDLIQVLGINLDLHDRIRRLVTTLGDGQGVDPRFAPPAVLAVLASGNADMVARIIDARLAQDPLTDMTGLNQSHLAQGASGPYRFTARHRGDRFELSRVRWIQLGGSSWRELRAEAVESVALAGESADGT